MGKQKCCSQWLHGYLSKPISTEELRKVLTKYLKIGIQTIRAAS